MQRTVTTALAIWMVVGSGGCGSDANRDAPDPAADDDDPDASADAPTTSGCTAAGGVCTSVAFLASSAEACDGAAALDESCGDHTFRVCCQAATRARSATATSSAPKLGMPSAAVKFMNANDMGNHHLGWHMSRRWNDIDARDQQWLKAQGWSRAAHQEGEPGNGLEFLAMHRFVLQTLRSLPELKSSRALFDGWKRVPDPQDTTMGVGPDSLAQNPTAPGTDPAIPSPLRAVIATCQDDTKTLARFATDDDFGRFIETSLQQAGAAGAGLHNYLHNRFSSPGSPIDLGDPQKNFKNQVFWRVHGWIDRCWSTYRQLTHKRDDDPAYVAALAKGAQEMHLPPQTGP